MAPATRMSGNFGSNQSSNLDHILDNFNQFKRKHITQNRDIIKTNALAQLRIKELEEKILQLEGERAEKNLEVIRIRANMDRVERATRSVVRGWELVGAGLAAMAAIDGLQVAQQTSRAELDARDILDAPQFKQSSRIILDPHALPGGVARSVARPPEVQLDNLIEEDSREMKGDDSEEGISTMEVEETMTILDDITANQPNDSTIIHESHPTRIGSHSMKQEESRREQDDSPRDARKASHSKGRSAQSEKKDSTSQLQRTASVESLSSFADDEEVQLSDDLDDDGEEDILQSILRDQKRAAMQEQRPTKSRRKRGPTLSPDRSESVSRSQESGNLSSSDGESSQATRSSRRSSARDRKSINYALPKLNTKMRKPDPADLIPAQSGERGKGSSEHDAEGDGSSNREATPKRTLKGGSEVASTGNLRELRRQHQSSRIDAEEEEEDLAQRRPTHSTKAPAPAMRRRSSTGPQGRRSTSAEDQPAELGDCNGHAASADEEMTDISSSWTNNSTTQPWKPPISLSTTKSAAIGTPIPRNQSGQNIKALKVANRIQKSTVTQPSFNGDPRKITSGRSFTPVSSTNSKVLTSSIKVNQTKTVTSTIEKRNSLHAAMTWEGQNESSGVGAS